MQESELLSCIFFFKSYYAKQFNEDNTPTGLRMKTQQSIGQSQEADHHQNRYQYQGWFPMWNAIERNVHLIIKGRKKCSFGNELSFLLC